MARDLNAKHVVIMGASGVLGSKFAAQLTQAGVRVSAIVRDETKLDKTNVSNHAVADITDSAALKNAYATLAPFDGVINATGVVAFGNTVELDNATLQSLFAINAIAPIMMLRESAPHITEGGFFVNLSGVVAQQPVAGMAAYSASKAAAWAAMMSAGRELRRQKIDVIDARPPHTETGLATRPLAGIAPKLPEGLNPDAVAARIIAGIVAGERDIPVESFTA
jgi:short-subunit dehydrogenase